jgi:hypothetical protein
MSMVLRDNLLRSGLAEAAADDEPWIGLHPTLGSICLAALTDVVARENTLSPARDEPRMHNAIGSTAMLTDLMLGRDEEKRLEDAAAAYLHIAVRSVIQPNRLAQLPISKLIRFRERHRAELAAFREHVDGLGDELRDAARAANLEVALAHLENLYQVKTRPRLAELQRGLRGLGVESTTGAMGLKVDLSAAAATLAGGVAAAGGQLVLGGVAVAVTVVPYLAGQLRLRHRALADSPVAYLLAADRQLARSALLRTLRRGG